MQEKKLVLPTQERIYIVPGTNIAINLVIIIIITTKYLPPYHLTSILFNTSIQFPDTRTSFVSFAKVVDASLQAGFYRWPRDTLSGCAVFFLGGGEDWNLDGQVLPLTWKNLKLGFGQRIGWWTSWKYQKNWWLETPCTLLIQMFAISEGTSYFLLYWSIAVPQ